MASINNRMPAVSRDSIDLARTGHTCTFFIGVNASQDTVFANGKAVLRPGDRLKKHNILKKGPPKKCIPHSAKVNRGSPTVFAEDKPVARIKDSADRGKMIQGSRNVFANGGGGRL